MKFKILNFNKLEKQMLLLSKEIFKIKNNYSSNNLKENLIKT
jgi:hypothetical protein